jgi:ADP-heptose:LPS heptosyltransferase
MHSSIIKGESLSGNSFHRFLIIQLGDIGDVVLTTPTISALRREFPHSHITIAVLQKAKELMDDCPLVNDVISVEKSADPIYKRLIKTGRELYRWRNPKFDLAIDLRTGTRGAIMARLSGARRRLSFYSNDEPRWRNKLFTHLSDIPYKTGTYVADYYHLVLKAFDLSSSPGSLKLWINPERQERVDRICHEAGLDPLSTFVTLQPYSLWPYKELPESLYIQLIEFINDSLGIPVAITGGPGDNLSAQAICRRCGPGAVNLAGKTTIGEMAALLFRSSLFVGIDSAGLHIAAAVGRPTLGIFGPSSPESWAPRGDRHRVLQPEETCAPCREKGCNNTEVSLCLQHLPVEKIATAIKEQLQIVQ